MFLCLYIYIYYIYIYTYIYIYSSCLPWQTNNRLTTRCTLNILFLLYRSWSSSIDIWREDCQADNISLYWHKWMFTPSLFPNEYFSCHSFLKTTTSLWMSEQKFGGFKFSTWKPHFINDSTCRYGAWGSYNQNEARVWVVNEVVQQMTQQ